MERKRSLQWKENNEVYTPEQTKSVLDHCGIDVDSETENDFLVYCPFHGNNYSPAMTVSRNQGVYFCHSPGCNSSGNLVDMLIRQGNMNIFQAKRFIQKSAEETKVPFSERYEAIRAKDDELPAFKQVTLDEYKINFWNSPEAKAYMKGRHFEKATMEKFDIGFRTFGISRQGKRYPLDDVVVPMHDAKGMPLGFVGRSISEKAFRNSAKLPKSRTLFNYHRAKTHGSTLIIVEASFDSMRVDQAGYGNVGSTLGGSFSHDHAQQVNRSFDTVITFTDFDKKEIKPNCRKCAYGCEGHRPGVELAKSIREMLPGKRVLWAAMGDGEIYPQEPLEGYRTGPAKDPGDMTDEEIRQCLRNAVSNAEYQSWGLD